MIFFFYRESIDLISKCSKQTLKSSFENAVAKSRSLTAKDVAQFAKTAGVVKQVCETEMA